MTYVGHLLSWPMVAEGDGLRVTCRHMAFHVGTCGDLAKTFLFSAQRCTFEWDEPGDTWAMEDAEVLRKEIDATENPPGLFGISYDEWVASAIGEFLWFHAWQRIPDFDAINREVHATRLAPKPRICAVKIAPDYQIPGWMRDGWND